MIRHHFDAVVNFRDFGGHPIADGRSVRRGVLFRSAHFGRATDADVERLAALRIQVFIDFRGPHEQADEGLNRIPPGARHVPLPMYDPARATDIRTLLYEASPAEVAAAFPPGRAREAMMGAGVSFVTNPERMVQFADMVRAVLAADGAPFVINCSAGKDRTGMGAAIFLAALGVEREHIIADYVLSNEFRKGVQATRLDELAAAGVDPSLLAPFFGVEAEYMERVFEVLDETWGGTEGYLRDGLTLGGDEIHRLRELLVEG